MEKPPPSALAYKSSAQRFGTQNETAIVISRETTLNAQ